MRLHSFDAVSLLEFPKHHFERCLEQALVKHHRFLCLVKITPIYEGIFVLMQNVTSNLEVHPARIRRRVSDELPFMATEELIVRAVKAGGDRQVAHEVIRQHSIAAAKAVKDGAPRNDMRCSTCVLP